MKRFLWAAMSVGAKGFCKKAKLLFLGGVIAISLTAGAQLPAPKPSDPNQWNGTWELDAARSSPAVVQAGAPHAYRLTLGPATDNVVALKWEIPELGEIAVGRTDGKPMSVHRSTPANGLMLSVRSEGKSQLLYSVFRNGNLEGGGRMMLVDNGAAWVDLTWPLNREDLASELVYTRSKSHEAEQFSSPVVQLHGSN